MRIFAEIYSEMEQLIPLFAFPVNLIFAFLWIGFSFYAWKYAGSSLVVRFFLSPVAVISSIALFLGSCLWVGISGDREFVRSFFFVAVLIYMQTVLLFVTFRGWHDRKGRVRVRFILNHAGLLLALGAAFWGNPDNVELRMRLGMGEASDVAYRMDGKKTWLKDEIRLLGLKTDTYADGSPMQYSATLEIRSEKTEIKVNHPYSFSLAENIYLADVADDHCVLQIVREPWKYFALAGIVMMIAGALLMFINGPKP